MKRQNALNECCKQLKKKIARHESVKEENDRKKNLTKYIPDISRSVYGILKMMAERPRFDEALWETNPYFERIKAKEIDEKTVAKHLQAAVIKVTCFSFSNL